MLRAVLPTGRVVAAKCNGSATSPLPFPKLELGAKGRRPFVIVEAPKAIEAGPGVRTLPPHNATDGEVRPRRAQAEKASVRRVTDMVRELVALRSSNLSHARHVVVVGAGLRQIVHNVPGKDASRVKGYGGSRSRSLKVRIFEETAAFTEGKRGYFV